MSALWYSSFDGDDDDSDDYGKEDAQFDVKMFFDNIREERTYYAKATEKGDVDGFYMSDLNDIIEYCG